MPDELPIDNLRPVLQLNKGNINRGKAIGILPGPPLIAESLIKYSFAFQRVELVIDVHADTPDLVVDNVVLLFGLDVAFDCQRVGPAEDLLYVEHLDEDQLVVVPQAQASLLYLFQVLLVVFGDALDLGALVHLLQDVLLLFDQEWGDPCSQFLAFKQRFYLLESIF